MMQMPPKTSVHGPLLKYVPKFLDTPRVYTIH
jgi:hypothetical protein